MISIEIPGQDFHTAPYINYVHILQPKLFSRSPFWKRVSMTADDSGEIFPIMEMYRH